MPDQTEHGRPLLILPLPSDPELTAAVLRAAGDWWRMRYGVELVLRFGPRATGPLRQEEGTPYGRALVLREPAPVADPDSGNQAPASAVPIAEEVPK